jgi:CBS domain-containing protein
VPSTTGERGALFVCLHEVVGCLHVSSRRLFMNVSEIMTEPLLTCGPETSLAVAARLMGEANYGTLPVIDAHGQLVGIITDRDICLAVARTNRNALNVAVHEVRTRTVRSAVVDDDVHTALATMKDARVRRLPVRDGGGCLKGMLSIEDLVVRGLERDGINPEEIVAALRAMYIRVPAVIEASAMDVDLTPG